MSDKPVPMDVSSSDSDDEIDYRKAFENNESFRSYILGQIRDELSVSGPKIFTDLMKVNEIAVDDYIYTKNAIPAPISIGQIATFKGKLAEALNAQ